LLLRPVSVPRILPAHARGNLFHGWKLGIKGSTKPVIDCLDYYLRFSRNGLKRCQEYVIANLFDSPEEPYPLYKYRTCHKRGIPECRAGNYTIERIPQYCYSWHFIMDTTGYLGSHVMVIRQSHIRVYHPEAIDEVAVP